MRLYLNELSFEGQAKDDINALNLLLEVARIIDNCKEITHGSKGYIQRDKIKAAKILGEMSVWEFFLKIQQERKHDHLRLVLILNTFLKGQEYNPNKHSDEHTILSMNQESLKGSCLDAASISKCGAVIISLPNTRFLGKEIEVNSSISGKRKLLNIMSVAESNQLRWIYEPNPKHGLKSIDIGEHIISEMDLSIEEAQFVLKNGVFINERVYSYHLDNKSWYCFPLHHNWLYHGYKIKLEQNKPAHSMAQKILLRVKFSMRGQIFAECWWDPPKVKKVKKVKK